jgi:hypothetical protein
LIFDDGAGDTIPLLAGSIVAPEEEDGKYVLNNRWNTDYYNGVLFVYDGETAQESNTVFILSGFEDGDYGIVYAAEEDEGENEDAAGSGGLPNTPRGQGGGYGVAAAVTEMSLGVKILTPIALDLNGSGAINTYSLNNSNNKAFFDMDNDGFREKTQWLNPVDGWLAMDRNGDGFITRRPTYFNDNFFCKIFTKIRLTPILHTSNHSK